MDSWPLRDTLSPGLLAVKGAGLADVSHWALLFTVGDHKSTLSAQVDTLPAFTLPKRHAAWRAKGGPGALTSLPAVFLGKSLNPWPALFSFQLRNLSGLLCMLHSSYTNLK